MIFLLYSLKFDTLDVFKFFLAKKSLDPLTKEIITLKLIKKRLKNLVTILNNKKNSKNSKNNL